MSEGEWYIALARGEVITPRYAEAYCWGVRVIDDDRVDFYQWSRIEHMWKCLEEL